MNTIKICELIYVLSHPPKKEVPRDCKDHNRPAEIITFSPRQKGLVYVILACSTQITTKI
jgi:hypothetical protein